MQLYNKTTFLTVISILPMWKACILPLAGWLVHSLAGSPTFSPELVWKSLGQFPLKLQIMEILPPQDVQRNVGPPLGALIREERLRGALDMNVP